ncbi:hypothetical protein AB0367_38635, partial [Dactylosporangium sp. NPDC051484]
MSDVVQPVEIGELTRPLHANDTDVEANNGKGQRKSFLPHLTDARKWMTDLLVAIPAVGILTAALQLYSASDGDEATFRYLTKTLDIQALLISSLVPMFVVGIIAAPIAYLTLHVQRPTRQMLSRYGADREFSLRVSVWTGTMLLLLLTLGVKCNPGMLAVSIVCGVLAGRTMRESRRYGIGPARTLVALIIPYCLVILLSLLRVVVDELLDAGLDPADLGEDLVG